MAFLTKMYNEAQQAEKEPGEKPIEALYAKESMGTPPPTPPIKDFKEKKYYLVDPTQFKYYHDPAGGVANFLGYTGEILPAKGIWCLKHGYSKYSKKYEWATYTYQATKKALAESGPPSYICSHCQLYGHQSYRCLQKTTDKKA
jgi:hypothetical protein